MPATKSITVEILQTRQGTTFCASSEGLNPEQKKLLEQRVASMGARYIIFPFTSLMRRWLCACDGVGDIQEVA